MNIKIFLFEAFFLYLLSLLCCYFSMQFLKHKSYEKDISIPVTEPNTEELEVAAVFLLVLVLVARVEELPDIFNLDLQSHFVRSNISINPWGAPDLKHKHLSISNISTSPRVKEQ